MAKKTHLRYLRPNVMWSATGRDKQQREKQAGMPQFAKKLATRQAEEGHIKAQARQARNDSNQSPL